MLLLAVFIFLAVLLAGLWLQGLVSRAERQVRLVFDDGQLDATTPRPPDQVAEVRAERLPASGGASGTGRRTGLPITTVQFVGVSTMVALLGAATAYTLLPGWYSLILGGLLGLGVPRWWVRTLKRSRAEAFSTALDAALGILASYLRAGRSLEQAVQLAADETEEPVRSELQRAARAISLGATATEALGAVVRRTESRDFELVVVAVSILTRAGGNLAEVLQRIAQQIRERRLARRSVMAATAQVRMTAGIITAMPFIVTLIFRTLNPQYFRPMLESTAGQLVLIACYSAVPLAWVWIRSLMQVGVES